MHILQEFFKRVEESRNFIDYLNGDQAIGASLLMLNIICRSGVYVIALLKPPQELSLKATCVFILCVLSCLSLVVVNLRQALKLTNECKVLRNIGHELKPLHAPNSRGNEQDDPDSLILYTSTLDMEAKILKIPVRSSYLSIIMISITFVLLLMAHFHYINF